jgi:tRNA pseudouridine13 synthase
MIPFSGDPLSSARLKTHNEDFLVTEVLPFEPLGTGSHHFLEIRKDGWNTASVARWLADALGCRERDVGYCGHKDRHAVAIQFFTVPGGPADCPLPSTLAWPPGLTLVRECLHNRKLRRGAHKGNRFLIRLRDVDADHALVDGRLAVLDRQGFPNYFGFQRFGVDGRNVHRARMRLGSGKFRRSRGPAQSIEVSSLRSLLFNEYLAARVRAGDWLDMGDEEVLMLQGSHSRFVAKDPDQDLRRRLGEGDLHISGPLWGVPDRGLPETLIRRERDILSAYCADLELLETCGFSMDRRPLRALAGGLSWRWPEARVLEIGFELEQGSYATCLLAELFQLIEPGPRSTTEPVPVAGRIEVS